MVAHSRNCGGSVSILGLGTQSKTLVIWRGQKESDDSGARVSFTCNALEREPGYYILKDSANQIVARIELAKGCKWRELGDK